MPPTETAFLAPTTLADAVAELAAKGGEAVVLGGGTATALLLKNRLIIPDRLVWLGRVPGLAGIDLMANGSLRIGAMTTLRELARHRWLPPDVAMLADAARMVGNARVRAVATVGGALIHGDPRQDLPPVLLALGAKARVVSPRGTREIRIDELFMDFMETALAGDEIVTEVIVPVSAGRRSRYARFTPNSDDDYPTVGVAVSIDVDADGVVKGAALGLGGVGPTAMTVPGLGDMVVGRHVGEVDAAALGALAMARAAPTDDQRGSASYKRAMVGIWTIRTVESVTGSVWEPGMPSARLRS